MTEPITPYTTLQMTLEMERLQHLKETHQLHEQGDLAQEMQKKKTLEQKTVNSKDKAEKERIDDSDSDKKEKNNQKHSKKKGSDDKESSKDKYKKDRGNIIDIKI